MNRAQKWKKKRNNCNNIQRGGERFRTKRAIRLFTERSRGPNNAYRCLLTTQKESTIENWHVAICSRDPEAGAPPIREQKPLSRTKRRRQQNTTRKLNKKKKKKKKEKRKKVVRFYRATARSTRMKKRGGKKKKSETQGVERGRGEKRSSGVDRFGNRIWKKKKKKKRARKNTRTRGETRRRIGRLVFASPPSSGGHYVTRIKTLRRPTKLRRGIVAFEGIFVASNNVRKRPRRAEFPIARNSAFKQALIAKLGGISMGKFAPWTAVFSIVRIRDLIHRRGVEGCCRGRIW